MIFQVTSAFDQSDVSTKYSSSHGKHRLNGRAKYEKYNVKYEATRDTSDYTDDSDTEVEPKEIISDNVPSPGKNLHEFSEENLQKSDKNLQEIREGISQNSEDGPLNNSNLLENKTGDEEGTDTESDKHGGSKSDELQSVSESQASGRPKRTAGRSLFERNPDFALGREFARILRQKGSKDKIRFKKAHKKVADVPETCVIIETDAADTTQLAEEETWKSVKFRSQHLSKLDEALNSAGWSQAISSGKNMENEVFKTSETELEYVTGIQKLIEHFKKGSVAKTPKLSSPKAVVKSQEIRHKRVVKPTRKILDGLDFRRKVLVTKISCHICGRKFVKSKLKPHIEAMHSDEAETVQETEKTVVKDREPSVDNISIAESEISINSLASVKSNKSSKSVGSIKSSASSNRSTKSSKSNGSEKSNKSSSSDKSNKSSRSNRSKTPIKSNSLTPIPGESLSTLETEMSQKVILFFKIICFYYSFILRRS